MSPLSITLDAFECAACLSGFIFWKKIRHSHWRYFPIYLGIIFLTEMAATYAVYVQHNVRLNKNIYRFFGLPFEFLYLFWLFHQYFRGRQAVWWTSIIIGTYLTAILIDLAYVGGVTLFFDSLSYTIGNILLLILLLRFFIKFSNSNEILTYKSSMMFWVCLGLIVFYLGSLPFYGLQNTLNKRYPSLFRAYWHAQYILACVMYGFFIVAFLFGKPERRHAA